mmetsp:Transcript_108160/g.187803  ORF Transcript_108160/g.187803 Transcript_108160/m.187803 type:complete len:90 (+) Transcript_108160:65-334(+)
MLPLGRSKGAHSGQRAAQISGQAGRRRDGAGMQNAQDASMASEDATMGAPEELLDEEAGPEAEFEALLDKRVHTDYDKEFGDDFDDDDI